MSEAILTCLTVGGLTLLATAAVAAVLHRAIRIGESTGRADAPSLRRLALLRAWLVALALSGLGIAALMIVNAALAASSALTSTSTLRALVNAYFWLYVVWQTTATSAVLVTGPWGRPALRSLSLLRAGEARGRLLRLRLKRTRPVTALREVVQRFDRRLW